MKFNNLMMVSSCKLLRLCNPMMISLCKLIKFYNLMKVSLCKWLRFYNRMIVSLCKLLRFYNHMTVSLCKLFMFYNLMMVSLCELRRFCNLMVSEYYDVSLCKWLRLYNLMMVSLRKLLRLYKITKKFCKGDCECIGSRVNRHGRCVGQQQVWGWVIIIKVINTSTVELLYSFKIFKNLCLQIFTGWISGMLVPKQVIYIWMTNDIDLKGKNGWGRFQ